MPFERLLCDFDMSRVRTREDFQRELGRHFKMEADHTRVWPCISQGLLYLPTACTFRFRGWPEFERQMPGYARRLRRMIQSFQRQMGEETYTIEYA